MNNELMFEDMEIELNNQLKEKSSEELLHHNKSYYCLMHMDKCVARIGKNGEVNILDREFMPYDLFLEEERDFEIQLNNMNVFYHWCASRVLTLDRKYAKEILNSIGYVQVTTDKDRALLALSYHCVSLIDVFWIKDSSEQISFAEINLYDHSLNEAIVEVSLRGKQMSTTNTELASDLSTKGCYPKAWIRTEDGFQLLKDGGDEVVEKELLASAICQCFDIKQVIYRSSDFKGQKVTVSNIVTSKSKSMVSKMAFDVYAANHGLNTNEVCIEIDPNTYYGMNIIDYLVGNTDRHPENWGFIVDNATNQYQALYPLMDFNQTFNSYDTLEGANCMTLYPKQLSQREAALEASKIINFKQLKPVPMSLFNYFPEYSQMFVRRMQELGFSIEGYF